jgi:hypothetical protein
MGRICNTYGERTNAYRILAGKYKGKRPLGRPGRRWENEIKMDLKRNKMFGLGLASSGL